MDKVVTQGNNGNVRGILHQGIDKWKVPSRRSEISMTGLKDMEREIWVPVVKYIYKIYSRRLEGDLVAAARQ